MDTARERFEAHMSDLGWSDEEAPEARVLRGLCYVVEDQRSMIRKHIREVEHDTDRLRQLMEAHSPLLNTLGELQQRPAALEAAAGGFAAAERLLRMFLIIYRPPTVCHPNPAIRKNDKDMSDLAWASAKSWRLEVIPDDGEEHQHRPDPCKTCTERDRSKGA